MESNFIPKTTEDLYQRLIADKFNGKVKMKDNRITWTLSPKLTMEIYYENFDKLPEGYIRICYTNKRGRKIDITHWHPDADEIYNDLKEINDENNVLILKKIFGSCETLVVPKTEFQPQKYKDTFFKKHYIHMFGTQIL